MSDRVSTTIAAATLLFGLGACQSTTTSADLSKTNRMVPDAIIGALTGNTLEGRDAGGVYAIYYLTAPEGTQKGEMKIYYFGTNSVRSDTGNWWINDSGEYCRQWQQLASSVKCVAFMRSGDEILWVQGNEVTDVSRLVPGNPGKL